MRRTDYRIGTRLPTGALTESHIAVRSADGALVVSKRLLPRYVAVAEKFVQAARQAAELTHANIGTVLEVADDGAVIAEYVSGEDLRFVLDESARHAQRLPVAISCAIVAELARALEYAHGQRGRGKGMIHRDLSPSNIVITYQGRTKLLDFAVMKVLPPEAYSDPVVVRSKLPYFSPEHVSGRTPEARSDLFSLGSVLHEMLTSRRLFAGPTDAAILRNVVERNLPPPSVYNPDVPPELDAIVLRLLSRDLAMRTPSARALLDELEPVLARWSPSSRDAEAVASWMATTFEARHAARLELEDDMRAGRPSAAAADFGSADSTSRPGTVSSFGATLGLPPIPTRSALETLSPPMASQPPTTSQPPKQPRRGAVLLALATAVAVGLAVAMAVAAGRGGAPPAPAAATETAGTEAPAPAPAPSPETAPPATAVGADDRPAVARTAAPPEPAPVDRSGDGDAGQDEPADAERDQAARSTSRRREERQPARGNVGVLLVAFEPSNAQVFIDGDSQSGSSPLRVSLRPGRYTVKVTAPDHQSWSREIAVAARRTASVSASLERDRPRLAEIDIRSSPNGAEVRVDGAVRGVTPVAGLRVTPGRQLTIELTRAGYEPWTGSATGSTGEKLSLNVPLVKRVAVAAAPPPPKPAPAAAPAAPRTVSAGQMRRVSGDLPTIVMRPTSDDEPLPDRTKPIGIRVCVAPDGKVTSASASTSGEVAAMLKASLLAWRFQPYSDGGPPIAVCFSTDVRLAIEAR